MLTGVRHATPVSYLSLDPALWTPRQIAARGAVAGTFETFEPRWVLERPAYNGGAITVQSGSCTPAIVSRRPTSLTATVQATSDCTLELPVAYFPGWRISIDDVEAIQEPPSPTGRMRITVGPGQHRLEAEFVRTPTRWVADITSFAALLIGLALVRVRSAHRQPHRK